MTADPLDPGLLSLIDCCAGRPLAVAALRELQRDAARYRWLRDNKNAYPLFFIAQRSPQNIVVQFTGALADANIDEMMK